MDQRFRSDADATLFLQRRLRAALERDLAMSGVTAEEMAAMEGDLIDFAGLLLSSLGDAVAVSTDGSSITISVS